MKKRLTNLYDQMTMPPGCTHRIEKALEANMQSPKKTEWTVKRQVSSPRHGWWPAPALICLLLLGAVLFPRLTEEPITLSPSATEPIELELPDFLVQSGDTIFYTDGEKPKQDGDYISFPPGCYALRINNLLSLDDPLLYLDQQEDGTWNYYAMGGHYENKVLDLSTFGWAAWTDVTWDENGRLIEFAKVESANTQDQNGQKYPWYRSAEEKLAAGWGLEKTAIPEEGQLPVWLKEENGRLYFTFNGTKTDITDVISQDTPFTFRYYRIIRETRYFAVGGNYDPEKGALESIGWAEWNHSHEARAGNEGGYVGCHFYNTESEAGQRHAWYSRAIQALNIYNGPGLDTLIPQDVQMAEYVPWVKQFGDGSTLRIDVNQLPDWLTTETGLLYFQSGGKKTDITLKLSEDIPLIFVRQQDDMVYYYAIGCNDYAHTPGVFHLGWTVWAQSTKNSDACQIVEEENWCNPGEGVVYPWRVVAEEMVKTGQTPASVVFPEAVQGKDIAVDIDIQDFS